MFVFCLSFKDLSAAVARTKSVYKKSANLTLSILSVKEDKSANLDDWLNDGWEEDWQADKPAKSARSRGKKD